MGLIELERGVEKNRNEASAAGDVKGKNLLPALGHRIGQ